MPIPLLPFPIYNFFININNGCNLRCRYCWYNATNKPKPFEEMKKEDFLQALTIIRDSIRNWRNQKFYLAYPDFKVAIATKEPLLSFYSLIKPVLEEFEFQKDFRLFLLTNATMLTDEILEWCESKGIVIQTSIDGCEIAHNMNRMSHAEVVKNALKVKDQRDGLFIVSTTDKNTIPYVKQSLEFLRDTFPQTLIKFNFNIFEPWTQEEWDSVINQWKAFIQENDLKPLRFLNIYRYRPPFIDEGRGMIIGIDRDGWFSIKKPFHSSIPKLAENEILNSFNFGHIYSINYEEWLRYYKLFGENYSFTRFVNLHNLCENCIDKKFCLNCDFEERKTKYFLNDDECRLQAFRSIIKNFISEKEDQNG